MTFIVKGKRYKPHEPFTDPKTGEVFDDGSPVEIKLGECLTEKMAKQFAENVKNNVPKRSWNIWVEEKKP